MESDDLDVLHSDVIDAVAAVATALSNDRDLDELLHLIAERICAMVGVHRCSIHLRDGDSGLFRGQIGHANRDIDRDVKKLVDGLPADRFTQEIVETRRPVLLTDPLGDSRAVRTAMREWQVTAVLGVPMVLRGEVMGIVILDNEDDPHEYSSDDQRIALTFATIAATAIQQTQQTQQLRETLATVARQNKLLKRATQMEERLATRLLKGSTVAEIARAVATLTNKPCVIYDHEFAVIAECLPDRMAGTLPRLLDPEIRAIPAVAEAITGLGEQAPTVMIDSLPQEGLRPRLMLAGVVVGGGRWGYLAIVERDHQPLDSADALLARRAARNISLQLDATRRAAGDDWDVGETLTNGLIRGDSDGVSLQQRADLLGVRLDVPRVVCLLHSRPGTGMEPVLPSARRLVESLAQPGLGRSLAANVSGQSVVLLTVPSAVVAPEQQAQLTRWLRSKLDAFAPEGGLFAALSPVAVVPSEYKPAHDDAVEVMRCLEGYVCEPGNHVLAADDLGPGQLFLSAAGGERGRRFAHKTLGPLLTPDSPKMHELLVTLIAFENATHNVRAAAEALHVHPNTVRYRLTRIQALTGLNLIDDTNARVAAHMSLTILRLGGDLPPPS
jgi:sugar diacid utilization regulator